ncbi:collagen alpha-1(I) chain-like [Elephas maximus indicus]|uniref:collagen alpha-1(I) chain-like n=1 Tax=Elephas maximus indicus TaxID=99487 RepID=UPI002115DAAC|nr:collagen alpha-1(I) chain-like [Elephas maximus indicus]
MCAPPPTPEAGAPADLRDPKDGVLRGCFGVAKTRAPAARLAGCAKMGAGGGAEGAGPGRFPVTNKATPGGGGGFCPQMREWFVPRPLDFDLGPGTFPRAQGALGRGVARVGGAAMSREGTCDPNPPIRPGHNPPGEVPEASPSISEGSRESGTSELGLQPSYLSVQANMHATQGKLEEHQRMFMQNLRDKAVSTGKNCSKARKGRVASKGVFTPEGPASSRSPTLGPRAGEETQEPWLCWSPTSVHLGARWAPAGLLAALGLLRAPGSARLSTEAPLAESPLNLASLAVVAGRRVRPGGGRGPELRSDSAEGKARRPRLSRAARGHRGVTGRGGGQGRPAVRRGQQQLWPRRERAEAEGARLCLEPGAQRPAWRTEARGLGGRRRPEPGLARVRAAWALPSHSRRHRGAAARRLDQDAPGALSGLDCSPGSADEPWPRLDALAPLRSPGASLGGGTVSPERRCPRPQPGGSLPALPRPPGPSLSRARGPHPQLPAPRKPRPAAPGRTGPSRAAAPDRSGPGGSSGNQRGGAAARGTRVYAVSTRRLAVQMRSGVLNKDYNRDVNCVYSPRGGRAGRTALLHRGSRALGLSGRADSPEAWTQPGDPRSPGPAAAAENSVNLSHCASLIGIQPRPAPPNADRAESGDSGWRDLGGGGGGRQAVGEGAQFEAANDI